ncbi:MAG TPA: DUF5979 domain-containing protein [Actinomycetaceae bacterium]|nr:DUF5979 domain-containing protein [Actinomycetaceae bacterium]
MIVRRRASRALGARLVAALAALLVGGSGALALAPAATADPTPGAAPANVLNTSGFCEGVNPMGAATPIGSENGYTIFVRENAVLSNSELEGTLAVGGMATFNTASNQSLQYPILHTTGNGNANYNVPTVDGVPNRVLIQEFDPHNKIVQVKTDNATGTNAQAGAKIGDHTKPAGYTFGQMFGGGSGTTYYPSNGNNQSPQIDSMAQLWTNLLAAQESWGISGDVLSHFPTDNGTSVIDGFGGWITTLTDPDPDDQHKPIVLSGPTRVTLTQLKVLRPERFKISNFSPSSFLVVTVQPADVVDGTVKLPAYQAAGNSADGEGISYVLFDFSQITGDVRVTPIVDSRVRGSIYAPNANVIFPQNPASQFEGQLIAKNFQALQGGDEMHTNLFKGRIPMGRFNLQKNLTGVADSDVPAGTVFNIQATWTGGSQSFALPANGTAASQCLPIDTTVSFSEPQPPAIDGYEFDKVVFNPTTVTIKAQKELTDIPTVTATNTYRAVPKGTFNLRKALDGVNATDFPADTTFPVTATWGEGGTKTFSLPADGTPVDSGLSLPAGTVVTLAEGERPAAPSGYEFVSSSPSTGTITILDGDDDDIAWTVTNTYERVVGGFSLQKHVEGVDEGDIPVEFEVIASWNVEGETKPTESPLSVPGDGTVLEGPQDLPVGTEVAFSEAPVAIDGYRFTGVTFAPESTLTITDGENASTLVTVTNTYERILGSVIWTKVDDAENLLNGSEWTIWGSGFPDGGQAITDCTSEGCLGPDMDPVAGQFKLESLAWGDYALRETQAPAGYYPIDGEIQFTIGNGDGEELDVNLGDQKNLRIQGPSLPFTGGLGRDFFAMFGFGVLILGVGAVGYLQIRSRRREVAWNE